MKKIILSVFILGILLGVVGFVGAVDQEAQANITADLSLTPEPNPIDFGNLLPGEESIVPITLTPGTSDLSVTVNITGDLLSSIEYGQNESYSIYSGSNFIILANNPITFNTKLMVPIGQSSGSYSGTITYTILEATE
jgi:hypothetical protein